MLMLSRRGLMARGAGAPAVDPVVGPFGFRERRRDGLTQASAISSYVIDGTYANRALVVALQSEEGGLLRKRR